MHRIGQNLKRDILAEGNGWPTDDRIDVKLREKLAALNTGDDSDGIDEKLDIEREKQSKEAEEALKM